MKAIFSPGLEFLRSLSSFKKRKENSSIYVHVLRKRHIGRFRVVVVKWTSKKCTKKRHARVELLFWLITAMNLLYFGMYRYLEGRVLRAAFSFPTSLTTITVGQVFLNSLVPGSRAVIPAVPSPFYHKHLYSLVLNAFFLRGSLHHSIISRRFLLLKQENLSSSS